MLFKLAKVIAGCHFRDKTLPFSCVWLTYKQMARKLLKQCNEPGQKLFIEVSKEKSGEELHFLENDLTLSGK